MRAPFALEFATYCQNMGNRNSVSQISVQISWHKACSKGIELNLTQGLINRNLRATLKTPLRKAMIPTGYRHFEGDISN